MSFTIWSAHIAVTEGGQEVPISSKGCHSGHSHVLALIVLESDFEVELTQRWYNAVGQTVYVHSWLQPSLPEPREMAVGIQTALLGPHNGTCLFTLEVNGHSTISLPFSYRPWVIYDQWGRLSLLQGTLSF